MLSAGTRYHADLVPSDDAIAQMYEYANDRLNKAGLVQYEISNFCRTGMESRHNLRYWQRRPYLGLGLDASSMLTADEDHRVLRSTTTDDLTAYLAGSEPVETTWLTRAQQHEEAWFLGLRLNVGVDVVELQQEFRAELVELALKVVARLAEAGLLVSDGKTVRLTAQGRLLSNDVFQEFLDLKSE
jgi:oxygen-independent coproporphyrinogen-3 oxidase